TSPLLSVVSWSSNESLSESRLSSNSLLLSGLLGSFDVGLGILADPGPARFTPDFGADSLPDDPGPLMTLLLPGPLRSRAISSVGRAASGSAAADAFGCRSRRTSLSLPDFFLFGSAAAKMSSPPASSGVS